MLFFINQIVNGCVQQITLNANRVGEKMVFMNVERYEKAITTNVQVSKQTIVSVHSSLWI